MNDLDAAEAEALGDRERPGPPPDEVRWYLEHLPAWWADAEPDDRRALATTLFERIRVLGISQVTLDQRRRRATKVWPKRSDLMMSKWSGREV